jgi:hypothetical protein
MKKYLMTGIAAVAMCAAFTSCSHEIDQVSQEDLNKMAAEKVVNDYNQAFISAFGQPAANQTWGFGTTATRSYNVQGNLWHKPKPEGFNLEYDTPVTTEEKNMVFNYVNNPTQVETVEQISFTQYWVTQIWNGKNDENADGVKAPASISYRDQNGATTSVVGGGNMDQLRIKETADGDWVHCNNFNSANNTNYQEGGLGGRTLMISSGTYSFQCINSDGSHYSTKYIIVPGAKIHSSLKDFYYVCFDFEKGYTAEEQAAERSYGTCEIWKPQDNPDGGYWQKNENWNLPGFYKDANSAELKALLEAQKGTKVQNITFKGYQEGQHHFPGDGNYTDWIVRISPAKEISSSDYDGRIMAEDLSAQEFGDFDFNDVVFDYKLLGNQEAKIQLRAAGGTLELYVGGTRSDDWKTITGGQEVHDAFNHAPVNQMINTGVTTEPEPATFNVDCANNEPVNIKIWVKKNGVFHELTAHTGQPASKFRTACTTKWCDEYISISNPYPLFKNWVNDTNFTEWTTTNFNEIFADKNLSNNEGAIKGRY